MRRAIRADFVPTQGTASVLAADGRPPTTRRPYAPVHGRTFDRGRRLGEGRGRRAHEGPARAGQVRSQLQELLGGRECGQDLLPRGSARRRGGGDGSSRGARPRRRRDLPGRGRLVGRLYPGSSGFSYPSWRGGFYPADARPDEFLGFYGTRLPSVELNTTFYRLPAEEQFDRWAGGTPPGFRFPVTMSRRGPSLRPLHGVGALP